MSGFVPTIAAPAEAAKVSSSFAAPVVGSVAPRVPVDPSGRSDSTSNPAGVSVAVPAAFGVYLAASRLAGHSRRRNGAKRGYRRGRAALRVATIEKNLVEVGDSGVFERTDIRNLAIIAHVDHGKTTLTDALMKQCGMKETKSMDSNQLEMERGITILAKNAAVKFEDVKINLIDTPGHADFGGEVERILNMADGCLLLVDAAEGPMPQTKFVLSQALKLGLRVMVVINKVDKPAARPDWVLDTTFDLFASMGADDYLCDFPVCYASGLKGVSSVDDPSNLEADLKPLLRQIIQECPKAKVTPEKPLQMLVANLDFDEYLGRICIGRVRSGSLKAGQKIGFQYGEGAEIREATISKLWQFNNNEREDAEEIFAGDICAFAGMSDVQIGDTVVDINNPIPLPPIIVEEPTVAMEFSINLSPLVGKDPKSKFLTGNQLQTRLKRETLTNLALRMEPGSTSDSFKVKGRGTLQLGVLMENLRREGYEIMVSAPEVILRRNEETGAKEQPYEEAVVEVPTEHQGAVMEEFTKRGGLMQGMEPGSLDGLMQFRFEIPTAGMVGMLGRLLNSTRGTSVLSSRFSHWGEYTGDMKLRDKGSIVTMAGGTASTYSISRVQDRGVTFIQPGDDVYEGMCIGISNKEADMECNITKDKATSNVRVSSGGNAIKFNAGITMTLDEFLGHMNSDEMLEITPSNVRLCKKNAKGLKKGK